MKLRTGNVFHKNIESDKKIKINRWGTRSGKTYSILQIIWRWLITGYLDSEVNTEDCVFWKKWELKQYPEWEEESASWICTVVRKFKSDLKSTVIRDFEQIIVDTWTVFLLNKEHRNKTDKTYTYRWRMVEFMWADDQEKIKGKRRDILYCNEANALTFQEEFFQLIVRTNDKIFLDFNPDSEDIWINTELEQKRAKQEGDVEVIVSTYKDNPFIWESLIKEIESLKEKNKRQREIYWLWKYGKLEGVIFSKWQIVNDINPETECKLIGYGIDFWYNDPAAVVWVYKWSDGILVDELIYSPWILNDKLYAKIISFGINTSERFIADSSRPDSIEELYLLWLNIRPVKKTKGWVESWIWFMQQKKIYITSRSTNIILEFRNYCWDQDKNGNFLETPIDEYNHAIDAIRYVFMELIDKWNRSNFKSLVSNWID